MLRIKNLPFVLAKRSVTLQTSKIKYASPVSQVLRYNAGDKVLGYTVKQVQELPELQLAAVRLQHENTGADYFHVARDDKNNLFSVALRTTPTNSTGVPHILEHLSLCGSQRFPVRDPFFKMLNRSLSTFMNAFTGNDFTAYPFSTQNPKDFENLLSIYLDAVFFPSLRESDFRQEGWRLEHQEVHDANSPIIFKGVVFNEMKGVFSDTNQYYAQKLENKLYPTHAYSHVSGGDPLVIPSLTWAELKQFHEQNYHPSNSRFFTYGNLPMEAHLENIENYVLKKFSRKNIDNSVIEEKSWKEPREEVILCRFDPMAAIPEKQTTVSMSYLLNKITDIHESFTMGILSHLLMGGPNAPFYKSLIESGLGADYSPCCGYQGQLKQACFSIGLREIHKKDVDLVKEAIESTFDNVVKNGFPQDRIDGVLHNIELGLKHQTTNFGLYAALAVNSIWNHGGNPIDALKVNDAVQHFQKQMSQNPLYLQEKVDQYFQQNKHKLCLVMTPDESHEKNIQKQEQNLLSAKLKALTEEDKAHIFNAGIELEQHQKVKENLSCLPSLQISDVERELEMTPIQNERIGDTPVQICEQPTNDITYFKGLIKVPTLPEDLVMLLPLFSYVLTRMGAGKRDYKEFDQQAELKTGGLSASVILSPHPSHIDSYEQNVLFSSHSLSRNVDEMMNLWKDIFNELHLSDMDRLSQLIKMSAAEMAQSIPHQGHVYSMICASRCLSSFSDMSEKMCGLTQVSFMKNLAELDNYKDIIKKLQKMAEIIINKDTVRCAINASPESMAQSVSAVDSFIKCITHTQTGISSDAQVPFTISSEKCHFVLPFNVNYTGKGILTVPYNDEYFASLKTAAKLLSSKYLHSEIREKGGAYGGGANLSNHGVLKFYSYRDPNLSQTLSCFDSGIQWLISGDYTAKDIDEAKLGVFSEVDYPVSPGAKGSSQFLSGITDTMKQKLRERLFAVTKEDIIQGTNRYLLKPKCVGVAVIGPENDCTKSEDWILRGE